jgi:hypothetical protein
MKVNHTNPGLDCPGIITSAPQTYRLSIHQPLPWHVRNLMSNIYAKPKYSLPAVIALTSWERKAS